MATDPPKRGLLLPLRRRRPGAAERGSGESLPRARLERGGGPKLGRDGAGRGGDARWARWARDRLGGLAGFLFLFYFFQLTEAGSC